MMFSLRIEAWKKFIACWQNGVVRKGLLLGQCDLRRSDKGFLWEMMMTKTKKPSVMTVFSRREG